MMFEESSRSVVLDHLDVGVELVDRDLRRLRLRHPDALGVVDHLALEIRLVDDVVVDDPDRPDAGGGEVEGGRSAEPAGTEQQHLRVQHLQLALDADLGEQRVARVAHPLLAAQAGGLDERQVGVRPGDDPARDHGDVVVAEPGERVGLGRGAVVGAAVEEQALGGVGRDLVDPRGELALRDVGGGLEVGLVPLVLLADVDQLGARIDLLARLIEREHLDPLLDLLGRCHQQKLLIPIRIHGLLQKE